MIKYLLTFCFGIVITNSFAQNNTDVYIFDIKIVDENIFISNILNISNNDGYDNQPSFTNNSTIIYSATNNGKTDIALYDIKKHKKKWLSNTDSNEYSPLISPFKNKVSAVRIFKNGNQHLYAFDIKNGSSFPLIDNLKVGYYVWYDDDIVILAIDQNNIQSLNVANITDKTNKTVIKNIGRSLCKIPKSNLISYVNKASDPWEIRSYNPKTNTSTFIINALEGSEDLCWTPNGVILMAKGNELHKFNPKKDEGWELLGALSDERLKHITRLNINSDASKLALVVEKE